MKFHSSEIMSGLLQHTLNHLFTEQHPPVWFSAIFMKDTAFVELTTTVPLSTIEVTCPFPVPKGRHFAFGILMNQLKAQSPKDCNWLAR